MTRNIKAIGIALFAVLALSAVVASGASAKNLTSNVDGAFLTGTEKTPNSFVLANGASVKCATTRFDAAFAAGSTSTSEATVKPTYTGCTAIGQTTTIDTSECNYTITTPTEIAPLNGDNFDAIPHLVCAEGKSIKIAVGDPSVSCTVTVHPQTPTGVVLLTNVTGAGGTKEDINLSFLHEGNPSLTATYTSTGGPCGANGTGKLLGEITVKAFKNAAHTEAADLWID